MIYQCLLIQILEIPSEFYTLVDETLGWSIMSRNAYVAPSLLQSNKGANSNHLEKCLIITKT
jgi:hypothetical protein